MQIIDANIEERRHARPFKNPNTKFCSNILSSLTFPGSPSSAQTTTHWRVKSNSLSCWLKAAWKQLCQEAGPKDSQQICGSNHTGTYCLEGNTFFDKHTHTTTTPKFFFYYYFPELIAAGQAAQALIRNTISFAWCRLRSQQRALGKRQKWKESIPEPNLS